MPSPAFFPGTTAIHRLLQTPGFAIDGLGPVAQWPAALRVMLGLMLETHQPMSLVWGARRHLLYNEAYRQFLGEKHPGAFGRPIDAVWREIWDQIGPLVDRARAGESLHLEDVPLVLRKEDRNARCWFTFFYAPCRDEHGVIQGMYSSVMETTQRVLAEQRRGLLLELSDRLQGVSAPGQVLRVLAELLHGLWQPRESAFRRGAAPGDALEPVRSETGDVPVLRAWLAGHADAAALRDGGRRQVTVHRLDAEAGSGVGSAGAILALPVIAQRWPQAMVLFAHDDAAFWADEDLALIAEAAQRAATAIDQALGEREARELNATLERRVHERTAELEEARQEATRVAQRLQLTLDAAQIGDWDLDLDTDDSYRSLRHDQCFGYQQPIEHWGFERFLQHVHPDDRERVATAFQNALQGLGDWHFECRVIWPDGSLHWIAAHGRVYHADGRPSRMAGIVFDVTDRRAVEEELRDASRRKDEFLAMLAHELRNPLAPIGTAAHLLQHAPADETRVRAASEIIARQVRHMTELVDDLLDVSRVTRGLIQMDMAPLDLCSVVHAAVEQVRPIMEARGHRLLIDTGPEPVGMRGDRTRLVQVFANLLNNAAKYTPPGGEIRLTTSASTTEVVIDVQDNGTGIAASLLPVVFDLFTQAERTPDRSQGGLGIGLSLVKSIVQRHGGTVAAYSDGPGRGSRFRVALPRAWADDAASHAG